jgi:phosphatidate cytidylyltransferase
MLKDKSFHLRVISALVGVLIFAAVYVFYGPTGLVYSLGLVLSLFVFKWDALISFALTTSLYLAGLIFLARERLSNERLLSALCLGLFGFFYCILCPWLAGEIIKLPQGPEWFLLLLLVVFSGDTFAFFGGKLFGRLKLNPSLSPKKTIEGAISGIIGSLIAAALFWFFVRPDLSLGTLLIFGFIGGLVGQTGDLLMSLIKRVSQIKDSGRLLPGHGGVLDRIDGVLLVCPLIYTLATLAQ